MIDYNIHCDDCGHFIDGSGKGVREAWSRAKKLGARKVGGKHFCKRCLSDDRYKARASQPEGENNG